MASPTPLAPSPQNQRSPGRWLGVAGLVIGACSVATALLPGRLAFLGLGLLVLVYGVLQNVSGFERRTAGGAGSWFARGGASILTGLLLIAMPKLTFTGIAILLGVSWIVSGLSTLAAAFGQRQNADWFWTAIDGAFNVALGVAIAVQWPISGVLSVGFYLGLHYVSEGWALLLGSAVAPTSTEDAANLHPDARLGLAPHTAIGVLRAKLELEETIRSRSDRTWVWLFVVTFFAIHVSRMHVDWNFVGMLSPAGAVLGDVVLAILLSYAVVAPLSATWSALTRPLERRAWRRYLASVDGGQSPGWRSRWSLRWLSRRMRGAVRRDQARGSITAALGWGLRTSLPIVAIIIAVVPLWGVSWFFNSETWVTGAWEHWAEQRTDVWRVEMVKAVKSEYGAQGDDPDFLRVEVDGLATAKDFSFIVIGDTGEGDASQLVLKDQLLLVGQRPETKFLVVSSDVIYPSGAMRDYEPKFYLPFKGFDKPILALPGNHDWYDALESFTANFFEPKAARSAMRARREVDLNLTSTTEARTDSMIEEAAYLRDQYKIRNGFQRAPYFDVQTPEFALIVVDTGIQRRVDDDQLRWLDRTLERSKGKFRMALLGHPLYVAGAYQGAHDADFALIHEVLKKHDVDVVMAGDTHDFEFYKEPSPKRSTYHFVNGGGGAYLSIGTALAWPKQPATAECGHYPRADQLTAALDARMPLWKQPLWFWVRHLNAWPSSIETASAAFDYDRAPFFQSFMEVRVEGSTNTVKFWLHGCNGRLRWRDLYLQDGRVPGDRSLDDFVEFVMPMRNEKT